MAAPLPKQVGLPLIVLRLWLIMKILHKKLFMPTFLLTVYQCQSESKMVRTGISERVFPFILENLHIYFIQQSCLDKTFDETSFLHLFCRHFCKSDGKGMLLSFSHDSLKSEYMLFEYKFTRKFSLCVLQTIYKT